MKYLYLLLSITLLLSGCGQKQQEPATSTEQQSTVKEDYWSKNNCLRSIPHPTLDSTKLKSYSFTLLEDKGRETASWKNGDSLVVLNEGCELYWFAYTFYIGRYDNNMSNNELVEYCFKKVQDVDIAPIDFEKALGMIDQMEKGGATAKLGREYFLKMDQVSEMFEIEEIDLKKEYAVIKFSFAIGHL